MCSFWNCHVVLQLPNSAVLLVGNTGIPTQPVDVSLCDSGTAVFGNVVASGTVFRLPMVRRSRFDYHPITDGGSTVVQIRILLTISGVATQTMVLLVCYC
jgi:hypothetical protein